MNNGLAMYADVSAVSADELVERYAFLVKRIGHHLMARLPSSVQLDDLLQSGLIGLLEAARNYDATKGASFETYAGIRIRGAMIDDVRRGDWAPRSVHRNARRVQEAIKTVAGRNGRDAHDHEVATELGVSLDDYYQMTQDFLNSKLFSLEDLSPDDSGHGEEHIPSHIDGPADNIQKQAFRQSLAAAIGELPERERLVLALYYDEELNLKEIGLVLGVSESRVSQIHSQAAMRLRARLSDWQG